MAVAECPPHEEANDRFCHHHGLKTHVDIVLLIPLREFRHDFSPPVFRIAIHGVRSEFRQAREQRAPAAAVATRASSDGGGSAAGFPGVSPPGVDAPPPPPPPLPSPSLKEQHTTKHGCNEINYAHHSYSTTVRHKF